MKYKKQYHRRRKAELVRLGGGKCEKCGIKYNGKNACIFHWHHKHPKRKLFSIGNQVVNKAWKRLLKEIKKCTMLCANCHEMEHSGEF